MTYQDIENRIYFLTNTNSTSYTDANKTLSIARAMERVVSLINAHDALWQWDDSNYTNLPIATTTITSGQKDYSLATTHHSIDRIEVKDSGGNWHLLKPIDKRDIRDEALDEYFSETGLPEEYDLIGNSFFLYPTPNYTQAASIKVYFTRDPLHFSYSTDQFTDSTGSISSSPGFNSLFHDLLPLWAAYDYALANNKNNTNQLFAEIVRKEGELIKFYGQRERSTRKRFTVSTNEEINPRSGRVTLHGSDSNR